MSEQTPEPAAAPAEQPAAPKTREERRTSSISALKEMLAAKAAGAKASRDERLGEKKPAPPAAAAPPAKQPEAAATIEKIESAGGEAPEQKAGESETAYQLRLAKAYRELKATAAKAERLEKSGKVTQSELEKVQRLLAKGKENPLEILEHLGISYPDLVKGINEERYKRPVKNQLPPEIMEQLESLTRADKERRERDAEAARSAARQRDESSVEAFLKANEDRFPLSASVPSTARAIVEYAYAHNKQDVEELLEAREASLAADALPLVSSEKALAKFLKSKPELRDMLLKVMGLSKAEVQDPASIDDLESAPGTSADEKPSRAKLKALAIASLKEKKAASKKR